MAISIAVAVGDATADALIERLAPRVKAPGTDPQAEMGPIITREHRDRVRSYVDIGVEEGASLVVDEQRSRGGTAVHRLTWPTFPITWLRSGLRRRNKMVKSAVSVMHLLGGLLSAFGRSCCRNPVELRAVAPAPRLWRPRRTPSRRCESMPDPASSCPPHTSHWTGTYSR